ncbi:MAG TPA: GNAT family N-acetyltransferase [Candidatus Cybelea sp.]|nr:GNAT family N-acetyltransferase [Candidatus Cybelea sp.]
MTLDVRQVGARAADEAAERQFVRDLGRRTATSSLGSLRQTTAAAAAAAFDRLDDLVQSLSHVAFVAYDGVERAGFLLLLDDLPDEVTLLPQGFVAYMAVEPRWQGRGAGRALLAAAEDEARRRGLPYMALMVTEENEPARALYDRSGYLTERRLLCKPL